MASTQIALGVQTEGQSSDSIKTMAMRALKTVTVTAEARCADIGAGRGDLAKLMRNHFRQVIMVDDFNPNLNDPKIEFVHSDLNRRWRLDDNSFDFVFSLEVIEHLENPRSFFRELARIMKPGSYGFVSTPNNLNIFSRINFLLKGEHRFFQDSCYPAHITSLVKKDLERLIAENDMQLIQFFYNYEDVIPLLGAPIRIKSKLLSNSVGVLFRKPE